VDFGQFIMQREKMILLKETTMQEKKNEQKYKQIHLLIGVL